MTQLQPIFDFLRKLRQNNNHEWFELIRHKQFMVHHSLSDEQVLGPDFADHALEVFAAMKPFLDYLQPLVGPQMRPTRVPPKREERMARRERTGSI